MKNYYSLDVMGLLVDKLGYTKPTLVGDVGNEVHIYCKNPEELSNKFGKEIAEFGEKLKVKIRILQN